MAVSVGMCDDEQAELEYQGKFIAEYFQERDCPFQLRSYASGDGLLSAMSQGQCFDIVFLDIYMGSINGIGVAQKIREFDQNCKIIFVTNSQTHAIHGFEVQASHYLLKPVPKALLHSGLDRAMEEIQAKSDQFIQIQNRQGTYRVSMDDILFVESQARVLDIHLRKREELRYYDRLDNLEARCGSSRFLRCHKSFLVNLDHVQSIEGNTIRLHTGEEIPISGNLQRIKERFAYHLARKI